MRDKIKELKTSSTSSKRSHSAGNLAMGVVEAATPTNCQVLDARRDQGQGARSPARRADRAQDARRRIISIRATAAGCELAHWIASKDNPLTARVMVNRVWEHLLGQGLVESVDNFGALGNEPSHPELLDTLAVQFMNDKWSVKKLIRSIVLSRVYQLSSEHNAANYEHDPANKLAVADGAPPARRRGDSRRHAAGQRPARTSSGPTASPVMNLATSSSGPRQRAARGSQATNVRSVYLPIVRGIVPECCRSSTWPTRA